MLLLAEPTAFNLGRVCRGGDPELRVRTEFPGLEAQFRVDGGAWTTVRGWETVPGNSTVDVRVR